MMCNCEINNRPLKVSHLIIFTSKGKCAASKIVLKKIENKMKIEQTTRKARPQSETCVCGNYRNTTRYFRPLPSGRSVKFRNRTWCACKNAKTTFCARKR